MRLCASFVTAALVLSLGCATNPSPNATPASRVAHYGGDVLNTVAELQRGLTAAATASPAFLPTARQITAIVDKVHDYSATLLDALRLYDAATTVDLRRLAEVRVQQAIATINDLLANALSIQITDPAAQRIVGLIAGVIKVVTTLAVELAKRVTAGPSSPLPAYTLLRLALAA